MACRKEVVNLRSAIYSYYDGTFLNIYNNFNILFFLSNGDSSMRPQGNDGSFWR
ncbi:hypothetical protein EDWATA_02728 [Edwardsiella tarda ATCC 23685]|uniref:Uncharacterized protein n=1 Tax=Edwardsiella tarda ATCC 23685 TaxID=500638 RepID=D4F7J2_EDWTA|nr:hypothetical protein EDWATA_02728 [Edwardsiella tarda ATCC 23685]